MMKATVYTLVTVLLVFSLTPGCNRFGGRFGRHDPGDTFNDDMFSATEDKARDRLREIVSAHISAEHFRGEQRDAPLVRRRPYYFKEYAQYPDGSDGFTIDFREVDSRTRPLMAEVSINKVRYATRMHRKRDRAVADADFLRDTGVETLVYEWHNGRWSRSGAIFNAHKTEELVAGQWTPRREETQRVIPEEDQPGWFGRVWTRIRGGE